MTTQSIELEAVELFTISDDQLENYSHNSAVMSQWTCGNMTICGCY